MELPTADNPVRLVCGDALATLRTLPDGCVDLVLTDPPYFQCIDADWDNQWETADDYLAWVGDLCREWKRVLRPSGSLYLFASAQMAARVECKVGETFHVLNRIVWRKGPVVTREGKIERALLRSYFPVTETIIFAECGQLGDTLRTARRGAGISSNDAGRLFPSRTGGPTGAVRNWELGLNTPSREQYDRLATLYPLPPYEWAVRPFDATTGPHIDVWEADGIPFRKEGSHPCEKPVPMLRHMIRQSTRPGAVVMDCFLGSGSTGVASAAEGRRFVGIELDPGHFQTATNRINAALGVGSLFAAKPVAADLFTAEPSP